MLHVSSKQADDLFLFITMFPNRGLIKEPSDHVNQAVHSLLVLIPIFVSLSARHKQGFLLVMAAEGISEEYFL